MDPHLNSHSESLKNPKKNTSNNIMKENSVREGSDAGYSYSTGTNKVIRKEKKFLSTKTYTTKNDVNSLGTNKESTTTKMFPSIKTISSKNNVTSILSRIQ